VAIAAFLRVINTLENIRESIEFLQKSTKRKSMEAKELLRRALNETDDSIRVLVGGGLHPQAVAHLRKAQKLTKEAAHSWFSRVRLTEEAIGEQQKARAQMIES
jgi:copper homeostasis protein CutC